jgi:hypothetical protein
VGFDEEGGGGTLVFEPGDSVCESFWRLWRRLEVMNSFISGTLRSIADMMLARAVDEDDALYLIYRVQDLESSLNDVKRAVREIADTSNNKQNRSL